MIVYRKFSGWGQSFYLIQRLTPWMEVLKTPGEMLFYKDDPAYLVDISYADNKQDIEVCTYAMTPEGLDIGVLVEKHENKLREILDVVHQRDNGRSVVTINAQELREVTVADFDRYAPDLQRNCQVFRFNIDDGKTGFPYLYMLELSSCTGVYKNIFRIQTQASHWIYTPTDSPTLFGKKLVYSLLNSYFKEFSIEHADYVSVNFPSNGRKEAPEFLKVGSFNEIMEKSGVSKVIKTENGTTFDDGGDENPYGTGEYEALEKLIQVDFMDKKYILFSQMMELGIEETISILPGKTIISVEMDIPDVAKKMCLYEGALHILPKDSDWELSEIFDDFGLICIDDEETYPKFQLPSGE